MHLVVHEVHDYVEYNSLLHRNEPEGQGCITIEDCDGSNSVFHIWHISMKIYFGHSAMKLCYYDKNS